VTGFRPFFYLRAKEGETASSVQTAIAVNFGKSIHGIKITAEQKLDAMRGFNGLQPTKVWKISTPSLWLHKALAKELRSGKKLGNRFVQREDIYEANLPPYLKLFHELDLSPASPIRFEGELGDPEDDRVDIAYEVHYSQIKPYASLNIPLYVASYDIETYSSTGLFPVATNPGDEIMQIGVSFRWSDQMLDTVARYVLVSGTVEASKDPSVTFIACSGEQGLLLKFQQLLHSENPDILCGYNTFGFDDSYIAERAEFHKIELQLGRSDTKQWGSRQEFVKTEKKTFELASGKYAVRYFDLPGRLPVDLLLSVRREQNLDSYKLDNVANTFLRDKVTKIVILTGNKQQYEIHTKSTRGLFVGNLVRFDFIGHTINPYAEGEKFHVVSVTPKSFVIESDYAGFDMDSTNLYWSFAKDDITAKQMFSAHKGTSADRAMVAKYCIQDCDLVLTLMAKLDTLVNARGMADVCRVPIDFIFLRGQGIKIYSAVAYNASKRNQIIMEQESAEGDTS
jgi:DNA polymerase elongation subunit (family B)